jgi:hypothetical protein
VMAYQYRRGDGTLALFTGLLAGSAAGVWLLRRPTSWLSQLVDRQGDQPMQPSLRIVR